MQEELGYFTVQHQVERLWKKSAQTNTRTNIRINKDKRTEFTTY